MSDRLEFSAAPAPDPAREQREPASHAERRRDDLAFREAGTQDDPRDADDVQGDTRDLDDAPQARGDIDDAPDDPRDIDNSPDGPRDIDDAEDDSRDADDAPDDLPDEEWNSAPLPVPSSLPEGAVLSDERPRRGERGRLTSARSKARKAAVELLYEAEQRGMNAGVLVDERVARPTTQTPLREYTVECVRGVVAHWAEIDETLETYSRGWRLTRMPAVDRAILRVATWEILHNDDVPGGVAVSEAVVIAQVLSTDDSPNFVNGLLSRIDEIA